MAVWKPWRIMLASDECKQITEPPCAHCQCWKPSKDQYGMYRFCQAQDQFKDFSCFLEREL